MVKCSKIFQFFDDDIFTYLGPSESLIPLLEVKNKNEKRVFSIFRSQNRENNISMVCFEENKKGINFSDTYLGPEVLRITRKCDF